MKHPPDFPLCPLDKLHAIYADICAGIRHRYMARYRALYPFDKVEAASLDQMAQDEWRLEAYWALARNLELRLTSMGPRQRKSELAKEYDKMLVHFDELTDRYEDLYYRELHYLLLRRDATEHRLSARKQTLWSDLATEDFCVTLQSSI